MMERDGSLDDPTYVMGGASTSEVPGNENVFPFSANLGSLMVLEMLRSHPARTVVAPRADAVALHLRLQPIDRPNCRMPIRLHRRR